jgi:hypothetical protein
MRNPAHIPYPRSQKNEEGTIAPVFLRDRASRPAFLEARGECPSCYGLSKPRGENGNVRCALAALLAAAFGF